jgi:hypothetical protein
MFSLGLPIPGEVLFGSRACRELEAELKALPFARKIARDLLEKRREKLHATICNSLAIGEELPTFDEAFRRELTRMGPVRVELRGLFSGSVNVGRLYLRVYPERRDGMNVFRHIQRMLGRRETDLYVLTSHMMPMLRSPSQSGRASDVDGSSTTTLRLDTAEGRTAAHRPGVGAPETGLPERLWRPFWTWSRKCSSQAQKGRQGATQSRSMMSWTACHYKI